MVVIKHAVTSATRHEAAGWDDSSRRMVLKAIGGDSGKHINPLSHHDAL